MENNRIAKRVYVGEYAGSRSVGRPRKRLSKAVLDRGGGVQIRSSH